MGAFLATDQGICPFLWYILNKYKYKVVIGKTQNSKRQTSVKIYYSSDYYLYKFIIKNQELLSQTSAGKCSFFSFKCLDGGDLLLPILGRTESCVHHQAPKMRTAPSYPRVKLPDTLLHPV